MNSAVTWLADADEVGGLIGIMEAVESGAGRQLFLGRFVEGRVSTPLKCHAMVTGSYES